jgi:hypothetical protein
LLARDRHVGTGQDADAGTLARHVLMRSQGIATLAAAFRDEAFIRREVEDLNAWVQAQIAHPPSQSAPT